MFLDGAYDRESFEKFCSGFLGDFVLDERVFDEENKDRTIYQLGKSKELNLSILEFGIKSEDRNKRIAITQDAFKVLRRHHIRNALIAFKYDGDEWRLSLLTSSLRLDDGGKVVKEESNPRRYSYLLGPNAKTKTPYDYLIGGGMVKNFEDLLKRFSVEVVNEDFYKRIAELFMKLVGGERNKEKYKGELTLFGEDGPTQKKQEFAVRLIGRIVFCWFLKEKHSVSGIPLISNELLSTDAVTERSDYYHNVLEPLFFELLNTDIDNRKELFKSGPFALVPYLNGGLFSPQSEDHYKYNDATGGGTPGLVGIPDSWFAELFGVFNQYNFTVDENTSYDVDLSIDPEMLGRIFENLLAEINPETGESARKSTGSFYTPREIVDYMVDSSLLCFLKDETNVSNQKLKAVISYDKEDDEEYPLDDDEKQEIVDALDKLTILDPACGSGAFPIGILQKVVYVLQQVDEGGKLWFEKQIKNIPSLEMQNDLRQKNESENYDYIRKLGVIRQSIFGVDIQTITTEIAKLRCFLTLIIEEEVNDGKPNRGIHALPNLDFKFVTANSLFGLPNGQSQQASLLEDAEQMNELKRIRSQYFNAHTDSEKLKLQNEFGDLQRQMFKTRVYVMKGNVSDRYEKLMNWEPFKNESSEWFDPEWMFGVREFNIVIGNPPYGIKFSAEEKDFFKKEYVTAKTITRVQKGSLDSYTLFIERGYNLLKKGGVLAYIVPISLVSSESLTGVHNLLLNNCSTIYISSYAVRPEPIFKNAVVDTSIIIFEKTMSSCEKLYSTKLHRKKGNEFNLQKLVNNLNYVNVIDLITFGKIPKIGSNIERSIMQKIRKYKTIGDFIDSKGLPIYYRAAGGRYFKVVTNYPTHSSAEKSIYIDSPMANAIGCILSSNLSFWYYQTISDNHNWKSSELLSLPVPNLTTKQADDISKIYQEYLSDIERNSSTRISSSNSSYHIDKFKEYKIVKSKALIDKIDDYICPLYGLTEEETDFIKKYDLQFRMSGADD